MKIEIKNRLNSLTLFEGDFANIRLAVEAAVRAGTNLTDANLTDANLRGANLIAADLTRTNLTGVIGYPPKPKVEVVSRVEDPFNRNLIVEL